MGRDLSELGRFGVRTPSQSVARSGHSIILLNLGFAHVFLHNGRHHYKVFFHRRRHAFLLNYFLKISVDIVEIQALLLQGVKKNRKKKQMNDTKQKKVRHSSAWQIRARAHAVTNKMWPSQVFSVISTVNRDKRKLSNLYLRQVMLNLTTQCTESRHQPALSQMSSS